MAETRERIEKFAYGPPSTPSTDDPLVTDLFISGPAEFLTETVAAELLADPVWRDCFGENIDPYKREDYSLRALPALRLYDDGYVKTAESWFIDGYITLDVIFPANVRRKELQRFPSTIAAALVQQFRRESFFIAVGNKVPGLNQLGREVVVDKSMGFDWGEEIVPLTQIKVNFRMDLRAWDEYLESDYRTKDQPFSRPLGDLRRINLEIAAMDENGLAFTLTDIGLVPAPTPVEDIDGGGAASFEGQ